MRPRYRPWGPFGWIDAKLGVRDWSVLGVSGTEDRCSALLLALDPSRRPGSAFLRIEDPESRDPDAYSRRLDDVASTIIGHGINEGAIRRFDLLSEIDTIRDAVDRFAANAATNIIIDITAMPKWWFFPILRFLLSERRFSNILVTYSSAQGYGQNLSSSPMAMSALPTFDTLDGRTGHEELVVGIGFAPLGLHELLQPSVGRVRYLFPFPPGPPNFQRNWRFLKDLQEQIRDKGDRRSDDRWHVHMYDCPAIFEAISRFTGGGARTCALAPFGPKTVSLAMCLYALAAERAGLEAVPAYYSQPRRYATDYTTGIKIVDGEPDVRAYCLRLDGTDLYELD